MGVDRKYGRVVLERGTIAGDEPVVVFRAQDGMLAPLLDHYAGMCAAAGSPQRHLDGIAEAREAVAAWQQDPGNHVQVPQSAPPADTQ